MDPKKNNQAPVLSLAYIKKANNRFTNIHLNGYISNVLAWYHEDEAFATQFEDLVEDVLTCGCHGRIMKQKAERIHAWLAINYPQPPPLT